MLQNYIKTAFRSLLRQRNTTLINIIGLSLGIAGSLILFLLVQYHVSFDKFQAKYDRIYRVVTTSDGNNGSFHTPGIPTPLPPAFRLDFPEAEEVVFTQYQSGALILVPQDNKENKKFQEERGVVFTEPGIFKIFHREVIMGDAIAGLDEPNEAVISVSLAHKYFNREDVVGEVIRFGENVFKIAAVVSDPPTNTDLPFSLYLSYETIRKANEEKGWGGIWSDEQCYFLLKDGEQISNLEGRMDAFYKKHNPGENYNHQKFVLQPLADLHFDDRYGNYSYNTVSITALIALGVVAFFLIMTASINFINLTTAEAIKRSKEVGIRKTLGSSRMQLIFQFTGETSLVTSFALIIALSIAQLSLGFLNPFLELSLSINFLSNPQLLIIVGIIFILVTLLSGLYPAFVISSYSPALALKNLIGNKNSSGFFLRKGLVVVQFFISQFLIVGTLVLISQMNYFRHKELGFKQDAIINLPIPQQELPSDSSGISKMRTLANEISRLSGVERYSLCNTPPSSGNVNGTGFILEGEGDDKRRDTQVKTVDGNYVDLFGLKLIAGRNIEDLDTARTILVNRKLALIAGFTNPEDMIGKRLRIWRRMLPVAGVVEDFHTTSLSSEIEPTVLLNRKVNYHTLSLKINPQSVQGTLPEIQKLWEQTYPDDLFSYEFLDESIRNFYRSEEKSSVLLSAFTSLAIAIGCLGLFGLATFMINQKTKEIGVRKVMGASVGSIMVLFSREFLKLILLGFLLAAPLAWFAMSSYLDEFAYKISLGPLFFVAGFGITLLIAVLTVGYRSFRAAVINPVKALRYE
ncbi:MAG: ABC transporter permease [Cyclobacteriaceae bacterium]|nr:ABC transporter permease [Cyclobacteriaceae bacterium]